VADKKPKLKELRNAPCPCHSLPSWKCPDGVLFSRRRTLRSVARAARDTALTKHGLETPSRDFVERIHVLEHALDAGDPLSVEDVRYLQARCACRLALSEHPDDVKLALDLLTILTKHDLVRLGTRVAPSERLRSTADAQPFVPVRDDDHGLVLPG